MRLIREAAVERDLAERSIGRQHEPLSALDAATDYVLVRRLAETVAEGAAEVRRIQPHERGEIVVADRPTQVSLDVAGYLADLPRRQSAAQLLFHAGLRCTHLLQNLARASQTFFSGAALIVESAFHSGAQLRERQPHLLLQRAAFASFGVADGGHYTCKFERAGRIVHDELRKLLPLLQCVA
jgi:hypothetical protein